ncbi:hypothetical protein Q9R29_08480 [Rothia sp. ARF10]|nr:hypothetical protein [Rothia sp. ARF10]
MSAQDVYEAGRRAWVLGSKADRERYALIVHKDKVLLAIDIDRLVDVQVAPGKPQRRAIEGTILTKGHPVYDAFVKRSAPAPTTQNPIKYVETKFDFTPCRCGCGEEVRADFLPGHDQRAIHNVIGQFGSVAKFLDWFEETYPQGA